VDESATVVREAEVSKRTARSGADQMWTSSRSGWCFFGSWCCRNDQA